MDAINELLFDDEIDNVALEGNTYFIHEKNSRMFKPMDRTKKMIYKILQKAKDMGATTNEIKKTLTQDMPDSNITNQKINQYVK